MDEPLDVTDKLRVDPGFAENGIEVSPLRMQRLPDEYGRDITQLNVVLRLLRSEWVEGTIELLIYGEDGFIVQTRRLFPIIGLEPLERQILEVMYDVSWMARVELMFAPDEIIEY